MDRDRLCGPVNIRCAEVVAPYGCMFRILSMVPRLLIGEIRGKRRDTPRWFLLSFGQFTFWGHPALRYIVIIMVNVFNHLVNDIM